MNYLEAVDQARAESLEKSCTRHVYTVMSDCDETTEPTIVDYSVSSWRGDATVISFTNGMVS